MPKANAGDRTADNFTRESEASRMRVVVEFANALPVAGWTDEDVDRFRRLLRDFFRTAGRPGLIQTRVSKGPQESIYSRKLFAELTAATTSMLERFVAEQRVIVGMTGVNYIEVLRAANGQAAVGEIAGPLLKTYALSVAFLLMSDAGARLRRCAEPKCGRFFIRVGKMEHCSRRCARNVYMREFRTHGPRKDRPPTTPKKRSTR
jgi:predicted RNA-binding Zn ribbon-like protein